MDAHINDLNANRSMYILKNEQGIEQLIAFEDFDAIQKVTEPERDNDIDLEER